MRWEDERYVRLYTRDTPAWVRMPWEARVVFYELSRKVDRAGIMPLDESDLEGVAVLLRMPDDIVARGVDALLRDGCVVRAPGALVIRNFIAAQETRQSDRTRKAVSRENAAARAQHKDPESLDVTNGHQASPAVTSDAEVSPEVTSGHQVTGVVTTGHSMPSRTVPSHAVPSEDCTSPTGDGSAAPVEATTRKRRAQVADAADHPAGSAAAAVATAIRGDVSLSPICKNTNTLAADLVAAGPGVDVVTEVRKAGAWLRANPERRKTKGNDFLVRWVGRAQDQRGGRAGQLPFSAPPPGTHHAQRGLTAEQVFGEASSGPDPWDIPEAS